MSGSGIYCYCCDNIVFLIKGVIELKKSNPGWCFHFLLYSFGGLCGVTTRRLCISFGRGNPNFLRRFCRCYLKPETLNVDCFELNSITHTISNKLSHDKVNLILQLSKAIILPPHSMKSTLTYTIIQRYVQLCTHETGIPFHHISRNMS